MMVDSVRKAVPSNKGIAFLTAGFLYPTLPSFPKFPKKVYFVSSQNATALAAATFSESTPWYMGIMTL